MVGELKKSGENNMNLSKGLNDRYSGVPWTDGVGERKIYHLCTYRIEDEQSERTSSHDGTTYEVDILEGFWADGLEQSLIDEFSKQNIFDHDYGYEGFSIRLSSRLNSSISEIGVEKKSYFIPIWMCEIIHDWYKEKYKKR